MGGDLAAASAAAARVFQAADRALDMDLSGLCFNGPQEKLTATVNSQPAILAVSVACLAAALEAGTLDRRPGCAAGHSLGQYTALVAAGSLTFEDALLLVRERGRAMEKAAREQPGTMAALVGLDSRAAEEICRHSGAELANFNAPTQIVVGGTAGAIQRACLLAKERGGRGIALDVSGAFHTSLMRPAAEEFAGALAQAAIADPGIPVVSNVTARLLRDAAAVREDLREQVTRPVLWHQSVMTMIKGGATTFIEAGPGKVLTAQLRRTAPNVTAISIDGIGAIASPSNV
jgi:[acyl-carrier-protein] S-malonyltransferase